MGTVLKAVVICCLLIAAVPLVAQEVQWRPDYAAARREALESNRPLILDFGTDNCFFCKKLDVTTFREPAIVSMMNEKFIPLKVAADRESGYWLANNLRIKAYPTIVIAGPDGKILDVHEGYLESGQFYGLMKRALTLVTPADPDWMLREYQEAAKAVHSAEYAQAILRLKRIVEDESVKDRPVQGKARQMLKEIESQAATQLNLARQLAEKGQSSQAVESLSTLVRVYGGTAASVEGSKLLAKLVASATTPKPAPSGGSAPAAPAPSPAPTPPKVATAPPPETEKPEANQQRARRARQLLAQAKEDYAVQQYLCCLERLELLATSFADLPEGGEAMELSLKIKKNPEWMMRAAEVLSERLGMLYLSLAETWLERGQPQQAVLCLERIVQSFPGTRQAEDAQIRLSRIQSQPTRPVGFKNP